MNDTAMTRSAAALLALFALASAAPAEETDRTSYKGNCRTDLDRPVGATSLPPQMVAIGPFVLGNEGGTRSNTVVCNVSAERKYVPIRGLRVKLDAEVIESRGNRLRLGGRGGRTGSDGRWSTSFQTAQLDAFLQGPGDFAVLVTARTQGGKKVDAVKVECVLSREAGQAAGICSLSCGCGDSRGLNLSSGACKEVGGSWRRPEQPNLCSEFNPLCWAQPYRNEPIFRPDDMYKGEIRSYLDRIEIWIDTDRDGALELVHTKTGAYESAFSVTGDGNGGFIVDFEFFDENHQSISKWTWRSS